MFRNSSEKSSMSDARLFHALRQEVVEVHRRNGRRQAGGRGDQALRRCPARRRRGSSIPARRCPETRAMMPSTVPNSPMNGVTAAVVARNVMCFSSLFISTFDARISARSTATSDLQHRARRRGGCRRIRAAAGLPQLQIQLCVARREKFPRADCRSAIGRRPALPKTSCCAGRSRGTASSATESG